MNKSSMNDLDVSEMKAGMVVFMKFDHRNYMIKILDMFLVGKQYTLEKQVSSKANKNELI